MIATGKKEKGPEYYDQAYKKAAKAYNVSWKESRYRKMFEQVEAFMPENKSIPVFDVGCGCGQLTAMLLDKGWKQVIGLDYSQTAIDTAKKIFPLHASRFFKRDLRQMETPKDSVVLLTEVLEHVEDDIQIIERFSKENHVILSVPSFDDPAHVRYFKNEQQVLERYKKFFSKSEIKTIGPWFVMYGTNKI